LGAPKGRDDGVGVLQTRRFCRAFFYGETLLGKTATDVRPLDVLLFRAVLPIRQNEERSMDLAMTMALAMFGLFGASTVLFLYKLMP
jgi:hypothetical protein